MERVVNVCKNRILNVIILSYHIYYLKKSFLLGNPESLLCHSGSSFGHLWPSWGYFGSSLSHIGSSCSFLGEILVDFDPIFGEGHQLWEWEPKEAWVTQDLNVPIFFVEEF